MNNNKISSIVLIIGSLLLSILLISHSVKNIYFSFKVKTFPTAQGTIIAFSYDSMDNDGSTSYFLNIEYTYEVNDKPFTSKKFAFGPRGPMQKEWIDEGVKNFNEGNREVIVYYDPKDPSNAVLFTGKTLFMNIVILIYGLVIIVVFLYFILNKISNKPQKSADQVKEHYTSS